MLNQDSQNRRIRRGTANSKGWRDLEFGPGEVLQGTPPSSNAKSLLSLIHISDLHICDAQSPARLEVLDRFADPHNPTSEQIKLVGNYRAQEIMTTQTLDCMVQTVNSIEISPISKRKIDAVVVTGDVIDNAQKNELSWYKNLLDGGVVNPNSGDADNWEGVCTTDVANYDRSYWNPEGAPTGQKIDFPQELYGFPKIPGLQDSVMKSFQATGLKHKWYSIHGNHDALLQGTVPADDFLQDFAVGSAKVQALNDDFDAAAAFENYQMVGPASYPSSDAVKLRSVTPDANRALIKHEEWINAHINCGHDHGYGKENLKFNRKYWRKQIGQFDLIAMDTVNTNGGWQGSVDEEQFQWIKKQLQDSEPQYFIFLSHHPAETLFNDYAPPSASRRICETELVNLLLSDSRVILWLAGHTHSHKIEQRISESTSNSFWHIQTASNIDWPQQGRIIDIYVDGSRIVIGTSVFDHQGEIDFTRATSNLNSNLNLAGISRMLAGNDWQRRNGEFSLDKLEGKSSDRNVYLWR